VSGLKISMKDLQSVHLRKTETVPRSKFNRTLSAPAPPKKGKKNSFSKKKFHSEGLGKVARVKVFDDMMLYYTN
jgi:hypothetical protein